jgi:hypothetical protein
MKTFTYYFCTLLAGIALGYAWAFYHYNVLH